MDNCVLLALSKTSLLLIRNTKDGGMRKIRLKHLQWNASNLHRSAFNSHNDSNEYDNLLSTHLL